MNMMKRFFRDKSGATLVYATVIMGVAIGLTGLSLDMSAYYLTRQQAQSAADAAALAAAYQLPNQALAIQAAQTAPVAVNEQQFSKNPGDITIAEVNFYKTIPADDDDPLTGKVTDPADTSVRYVQVITQQVVQRPFVLAALGLGEDAFTAEAVATKGVAKCSSTALWMCMPDQSWTGSLDPKTWIGRQILVKYGPGSTSWAAGNYGLLADPNGNSGANALAELIGGPNSLDICVVDQVEIDNFETATGVKNSLRNAFNVRFDIYEGNMSGKKNAAGFAPAENVTKGYFGTSGNPPCNSYDFTDRVTTLPRDSNIDPDAGQPQFGNGDWDCAAYWAAAHPGIGAPPGCTDSFPMDADGSPLTRYEMYYREITDAAYGGIPDTFSNGMGGDDGDTRAEDDNDNTCYGGSIPATPTDVNQRELDRRILTVGAVDCAAADPPITGKSNVEVEFFVSMFMTEAVTTPSEANVYLEVVGSSKVGSEGLAPVNLNEWVELVR